VELRVHGIGGTSVASMLDQADGDALVPRWPRGAGAAPHVWQGSRPDVLAFHWARLTSGSRWFVLWPLALPFTLINVAGFMHSAGWPGRVLRAVHGLLCLVVTTWFASWLIFGGQELVRAKDWDAWVGVALAGAVSFVVVAPSLVRCGWEAGQAPRDGQPRASLENPAFFRDGRKLWALHATVLLASAGAVGLRADADDQSLRVAAQRSVVDVGMAIVVLIVLLLVLTLIAAVIGPRRAWQWALAAVGVIGVGCALIGGLMIALLRVLVGSSLQGTPYVLFDVYGIAALVGLAVGGMAAVMILGRKSPGERLEIAARVLPHPISWFRARLALLPRALALAIGAMVLTFVVVGTVAMVDRAPASVVEWEDRVGLPDEWRERLGLPVSVSDDEVIAEGTWQAGASPPVRIAHFAIYGLFVVMFVNLLKSWGAADALRRVGSVWDVLSFWPRRFHPFAVRPYTACAVDQLRELLFTRVDDEWPDQFTVLAHSQGSVLVVAALAPRRAPGGTAPTTSRVARLVTVGSPLRALYMKAFPGYVPADIIERVTAALAPSGRWTNTFRFTDHVGRTVFGEEKGWVPTATLPVGELQDRWWLDDATGCCRDCCIADPDAKQARVMGHSDYWEDLRVGRVAGRAPASGAQGR
jgi:hypothetical protein